MNKYKVEKFDKPIRKCFKDVKKYDVERFEYGDDGKWTEAVIFSITHKDKNSIEVLYSTQEGRNFIGYSLKRFGECYFEIVGTATEMVKDESLEK